MFTGIQEILVLVVIILVILFLPRILNRRPAKKALESKTAFVVTGKMRLAIAVSILWPAAVAALIQPWKKALIPFLYLGFGPVAFAWILFWVFTGFRKNSG